MEQDQPFDDRAESFLQVGDVAAIIARRHSHLDIDETTHERWRQLMGLLREADTLLDDTATTSEEVIDHLRDFSDFRNRYPALAPSVLDDETREALIARAERIIKLGKFIAKTESVDRFVALRVQEGSQTAGLLADSATDYVRQQPQFRHSFIPTMRSLGSVASTIDSMMDGQLDYKTNKMRLRPSREFYRKLAGASFAHMKLGALALLTHGSVMGKFAVMSATRLRNRMTHGMTPSSSLRLFRE